MTKEYRFATVRYDEEAKCLICPECGKKLREDELLHRIETKWVCADCAVRWANENEMPSIVRLSYNRIKCAGRTCCAGIEAVTALELMGVILR